MSKYKKQVCLVRVKLYFYMVSLRSKAAISFLPKQENEGQEGNSLLPEKTAIRVCRPLQKSFAVYCTLHLHIQGTRAKKILCTHVQHFSK